ncbi:MAG: TonB-dependent receptor [Acidobacteriota bacterium]|nr:TonB-dependent receptor [Acidobacteriota bacterium]
MKKNRVLEMWAPVILGVKFMGQFKRRVGVFIALFALVNLPVFPQATSGNITGTVYDPTGATVPAASTVAHNMATGVDITTSTTSAGDYRFENLPIGTYTLTVSAPGFVSGQIANVNVPLNQTVTANVKLTIGQASTRVEVTEAAAPIDTTTAQIQTTYNAKQISDLPSASTGSGVMNLALLNAGVTTSGGAGYGTGPSVGGQRPTNNSFSIEGIDNNDLAVTGPIVSVPNDAVAEFSVLQNQFSPDFGHSSGGQFNEVVKSGTNQLHGAAYEYFNNRNLNAADNLNFVQGNPLHPRSDNNRFGGNLGGPIKRNKLFFFGDYEYNPAGGVSSTAYYAPTAAGYSSLGTLPGINQTNLAEFQKYLGTAPVAVDPSTLPNGAAVQVAPGPGSNQSLKTGVFAPGATGAITIPAGLISSSLPSFVNSEFGVGSVDYNISDKDSLRGRFILNRTGIIDATGFPSVFFGITPVNAYLATLSEYHTFTPTLINEFRFGYNRLNDTVPVFGNQSFPGLDAFPNIDVLELNAAYGPDSGAPQYRIQNLYHLTDNVTWTKGNHSFKLGFDGWTAISPSHFIQRSRGDYEWTSLSDYLYDTNPDNIAQRALGNTTYYQNQQLVGFFANDNWKLTPNLTLNLGLRYEYLTVPLGETTQCLNMSASVPGLIVFDSPTAQKTNFMPRVGLAYSPGTSGRTSIRAGFGLTYDVLYDNLGTTSSPPQLSSTVDVTGLNATGFLAGGGIPPSASVTIPEGAAARAATSSYIPNQKRPEAYNWNFGIQHQFAGNYVFETRYLGTRGLFLPMQVQLNRQPTVNASNALPVFFTMPSQGTLNSLTSNLASLQTTFNDGGYLVPAYANAGFTGLITAFTPQGNSIYHGWANQLSRRFSNGLQFQGSYTWSHNIDDSTDALSSTVLAPRRPMDSQDLRIERASSLLDYRNRIVLQMVYDVPYFKNRNWWLKNIIGNWEIAPVYTYQSGQHVTPQTAIDSNLNGDSAPDRVFVNPAGNRNLGTTATPLTNSANDTVAYLAANPAAMFVTAPKGTLPDGGRSLLNLNPIDDIDLTLLKRVAITERFKLEFSARAINIFNHPQYTGGYLNDVAAFGPPGGVGGGAGYQQGTAAGNLARTAIEPGSSIFQQWSQAFSSNPRSLQLALKLIF